MTLEIDATITRGTFTLDVTASAQPGRVLGILGPNGAGKSTLLRAVAGLVPLTRGRIALDGDAWDDTAAGIFVPPERRHAGMVFQDHRLFPHLDVLANVAFGPRSRGASRTEAVRVAAGALDRVGAGDLAARRPRQLSGGQEQRVALARALAGEPRVLLFDEPLAALDAGTRLTIRADLRGHMASFPGPVLLVTHDAVEAAVLADDLIVLEQGRVVQAGTPAEIARRPATDYVARLAGVNLYRGRHQQGVITLDRGGSLIVPPQQRSLDRVLVALSPSAVTLHTSAPVGSSTRNVWTGTVASLEPVGGRVRVRVDGAPPVLADVTALAVAELGLAPGRQVWASAKATELDVYADA